MRQSDLGGDQRFVISHIGERVMSTVLELNGHAAPELVKVNLADHAELLGEARNVGAAEFACHGIPPPDPRYARRQRSSPAALTLPDVPPDMCDRAFRPYGRPYRLITVARVVTNL